VALVDKDFALASGEMQPPHLSGPARHSGWALFCSSWKITSAPAATGPSNIAPA